MPNKMLIDASHPEETRVVVTRGNRIEEFDFESQDKKQLRGNIYLARVTRVEPSLQAAFIEYGGNRHGFLAFSEIHPDYYQIPVADRQALLQADAEAAEAEDEEDEDERSGRNRRRRRGGKGRGRDEDRKPGVSASSDEQASAESDEASAGEMAGPTEAFETAPFLSESFEPETASEPAKDSADADDSESSEDEEDEASKDDEPSSSMPMAVDADTVSEPVEALDKEAEKDDSNGGHDDDDHHPDEEIESVGAGDAFEEAQPRRRPQRRQYKIQEVIKRRQILLVQVVKEERGNKGAALTTYLSLAGRYSVLMPNTARGGGISRKITNAQDRKRLKDVVKDLAVPQGMGVILRTAGESRTKAEIKRDYEYLMRLWENVRTLTLQSTAPALVYEEGSLIKRSVRDLYNKDIDEVLVSGEEGYREAKDFMRMLMPSHAKVVQPHRDTVPIFARAGIEAQLDKMLQPQVNLKSGGYIIINQTEALVAIDVNSGRSTKEHSIEDTALQTNLEAAEEVARQLRLRDLAGLIVIDFIDMEENRNNRSVEKRLKDHLKNDRARIQVGRISHFGLLEMSRQRIRTSVLESTTQTCPHCGGSGHVRSESSVALHVIRAIEEYLLKDTRHHITVRTPVATALYVLNHKRATLVDLERRFGLTISLEADETLGSQHYAISRGGIVENPVTITLPTFAPIEEEDEIEPIVDELDEDEAPEQAERASAPDHQSGHGDRDNGSKRKRRRRRRGGRDRERGDREHVVSQGNGDEQPIVDADGEATESADAGDLVGQPSSQPETDDDGRKRRRGKRGGRRNRRDEGEETGSADATEGGDEPASAIDESEDAQRPSIGDEALAASSDDAADAAPVAEVPEKPAKPAAKPRRRRTTKAEAAAEAVAQAPASPEPVEPSEPTEAPALVEDDVQSASLNDAPETPARRRASSSASSEPVVTSNTPESDAPEKPRKGGWWQRKSFFGS